jgi:hypothetical protein
VVGCEQAQVKIYLKAGTKRGVTCKMMIVVGRSDGGEGGVGLDVQVKFKVSKVK